MIRFALFISLAILAACSAEKENAVKSKNEITIDSSAFAGQVGLVAYTSLSKANQSAQTLDSKLASFMYHPNPMSQAEIQKAWRNAYNDFLASLIFSYLPIQDPPDWHTQRIGYRHLLTQLDSWPIEGGYIDYIQGYPYSGIVNDLTLTIDEESIRSQHGFTDSTNASLGYHALEFMFWGGQGQRTAHDFFPQENTAPVPINDSDQDIIDSSTETTDEQQLVDIKPQNHNRRRQYTQLLSELLLKDLHRVQRRWEPSSGYYAQLLQQSSTENTLQATFVAAQELISKELLYKRFQLISSEFSQSSQQDLLAVISGLESWFIPTDTEQQEASLLFLMQQANKEQADAFATSLQQTKTCINKMTTDPKDIDQCKQDTIQLLSDLRRTATSLKVKLPDLD